MQAGCSYHVHNCYKAELEILVRLVSRWVRLAIRSPESENRVRATRATRLRVALGLGVDHGWLALAHFEH